MTRLEEEHENPQSLPNRIKEALGSAGLEVGYLEEKWYQKGRLDQVLLDVERETGMEDVQPVSNILLHVFPKKPLGTFAEYDSFSEKALNAIDDLEQPGNTTVTGERKFPSIQYANSKATQPSILHLSNIDLMDQPLKTVISLANVIFYTSEEVARKYMPILQLDDRNERKRIGQSLDFPISWDLLGNFTPPERNIALAPTSSTSPSTTVTETSTRGGVMRSLASAVRRLKFTRPGR